jgi:hypothetical protein
VSAGDQLGDSASCFEALLVAVYQREPDKATARIDPLLLPGEEASRQNQNIILREELLAVVCHPDNYKRLHIDM